MKISNNEKSKEISPGTSRAPNPRQPLAQIFTELRALSAQEGYELLEIARENRVNPFCTV